ncbi:gamma-butyrobetaine hydroxylase-like domain-containing protein [Nisaea sp.]|uniref:gamma-butyrobetaine hydroxylase-like domain-containing protein n=1 Tax=Nisaea sp. TaxID=2024842 RepID=UPI003B523895
MSDGFSTEIWPTEIRVQSAEKCLEIDFDTGESFSIPAELLRVESPSAEVQGHVPSQKKLVSGRAHVNIMGMEPVGNYAVRIKFDDLHDSGIYTWRYLHKLGAEKDQIWTRYLKELEEAGLSREP